MSPRDFNLTDATVQHQDATERTKAHAASDSLLKLLFRHHPEQAPANLDARRRAANLDITRKS